MADPLLRYIHHETQEPGSMLCAAHALNNLVQADHFDPSTLAELGKQLDELEHSYRSEGSGSSRAGAVNGRTNGIGRRVEDEDHDGRKGHYGNYDDSGFFSLAVMERALGNFGLRLVRWRSEEMRAEHDRPENQEAFVLNLSLHWITLRRFGQDPNRWYNLNSFYDEPAKVGQMYLGMTVHSAEKEGYSVFCIRPIEPASPPSTSSPFLPPSPADEFALSQRSSSSSSFSSSSTTTTHRKLKRPSPKSDSDFARGDTADVRDATYDVENLQISAQNGRRTRRRLDYDGTGSGGGGGRGVDEEEEMMRRAIEASLKESGTAAGNKGKNVISVVDDDDDDEVQVVRETNPPPTAKDKGKKVVVSIDEDEDDEDEIEYNYALTDEEGDDQPTPPVSSKQQQPQQERELSPATQRRKRQAEQDILSAYPSEEDKELREALLASMIDYRSTNTEPISKAKGQSPADVEDGGVEYEEEEEEEEVSAPAKKVVSEEEKRKMELRQNETADEDDSPTLEELRRRRMARLGFK